MFLAQTGASNNNEHPVYQCYNCIDDRGSKANKLQNIQYCQVSNSHFLLLLSSNCLKKFRQNIPCVIHLRPRINNVSLCLGKYNITCTFYNHAPKLQCIMYC